MARLDRSPFFLWNHYMDPHGPYDPPEEHARKYFGESTSTKRAQRLHQRGVKNPDSISQAERSEMIDLYDGEISYVDAKIGEFLDTLETRGLLEESLVILTADHGDAFGEHGYYAHPRKLDDELLHVPMVLRTPDAFETPGIVAQTVDRAVSTLDIVPTLLSAAGIDHGSLPGRSLFKVANTSKQAARRSVFSEVRGQKKENETHLRRFVVQSDDGQSWLERAIESGEITRGPTGDESVAQTLREFSAGRLQMETTDSTDGSDETADEVERRLEALWYK